MFVVANRSTTLTNFYPKGDVKSSTSDSFAGPSFPTQWSAEESAGVVLEGRLKSNFSEQIKIENSRDMTEKWEDEEEEEEEEVDDMRAVSDDEKEECNGMDNSIDSAVDVQEYDRPKVASFADLGALTGWTLDPEPVETKTETVTSVSVTSSRGEKQSIRNTQSAGIEVANKKHDGNREQKDDEDEDENEDEDEDSGSEYSQEYEEELRDSDKEEEEREADVNLQSKQKNNEFEKPPIATSSVSVMIQADSRKDPTVDAAKSHTTDDIKKSLSSLTPVPAPVSSTQQQLTYHSGSTNFNVTKNDVNALKDHEIEIMGGDSRIYSLNKDLKRVEVEVEVEVGHSTEKMADASGNVDNFKARASSTGSGTGTKSGISNDTETHFTHMDQMADSFQTTSAPSSSSYAATSFHHDADGRSQHPNPYLQGSEQRSINQPHSTVEMLATQSANATAARQLQLQLQPQHTLSPVLASQHRVPLAHSLIPSFSPLEGHLMGSSTSAPGPAPGPEPAMQTQPEVPFRHNQSNHESNSENYRYIDEGKYLSYPPPLQHSSYAPSHAPSMPVHPMQSSQQHHPHSHPPSPSHTSTAQPPHTSHPLSPSHYGTGYPTPTLHPSYPYYPHPPHPLNVPPFSSSLPYHPSMYPPTHISAQQPYPVPQSDANDIYHMQSSMPYHNTHQQSQSHPYPYPHTYGLSASTPGLGLGPSSAGYGMYPHSSSSSLPMYDTLPLRHGLPMSGLRPNMNMNMNMRGSTDAYNNTQGKTYNGTINGVSGGLNEKKISNQGIEDLMRDLREAKVRNSS